MRSIVDILKYALVLLMFVLFIYSSYLMPAWSFSVPTSTSSYQFPEVKANADPWYDRVVTAGEMQSTSWILNNTNKSDKFVTDIFGAEMIMGMTTRVSTTGGDWANAPDPVKMMSDTNEIYVTDNSSTAHDLAEGQHADYVFSPTRYTFSGFGWVAVNQTKFGDQQYFQLEYQNPSVSIYKVLQ